MREIRFRAWNIFTKRLLNWAEIAFNVNPFFYDDPEFILEQYTGLKDKNGKKIYEGDIVHLIDHPEDITTRDDVVIFEYGTFTTASETAVPLCDYGMVWVEVIGNIHENPELIQQEALK